MTTAVNKGQGANCMILEVTGQRDDEQNVGA